MYQKRTWFELNRHDYYTNPTAIRTTAELATVLQHFHVTASEDELRLLMVSFGDESGGGGFSLKRLAARLYPMDRSDGWGFQRRGGVESVVSAGDGWTVPEKGVAERFRSEVNKANFQTSAAASTSSSFPVVYASPSSSTTASSKCAFSNRATSTAPARTINPTAPTASKSTGATTTTKRPSTASSSSSSRSAGGAQQQHHTSSRYVKKETAIGRVYNERVYDSSLQETQRTAYVKYINDGYWVRV